MKIATHSYQNDISNMETFLHKYVTLCQEHNLCLTSRSQTGLIIDALNQQLHHDQLEEAKLEYISTIDDF